MPAQSKDAAVMEAEAKEHRAKVVKACFLHTFQSVAQHCILLQSEPMLVRTLCGGDGALTAKFLANSAGLVGLLGLMVNQAGGKISDAVGRRPFLLMGPVSNILWGLLVYLNPTSKATVLVARILRQIMTTFSNTVMIQSALSDTFSGSELKEQITKIGAVVGLGVIGAPILEAAVLKRTKDPKYSYLMLALMAGIQSAVSFSSLPETLEVSKRIKRGLANVFSTINPLGFINIYTRGSSTLSKLVTVCTLQNLLEGRNLSDLSEIWKRDHLKWSVEGSRNFVVLYGVLVLLASAKLTPHLLATMSNRGFTSLTNTTNFIGFVLRSFQSSPMFILAMLPMLPGVNGNSARALSARASDLAVTENFGMGEFSAYSNNLRALGGAAAPVIFGNFYAWCLRNKVAPGSVFAFAGLLGAVLPEILVRCMRDDEVEDAKKKKRA